VPGSLLFLQVGIAAPEGYVLLGTTEFKLVLPNKKSAALTVNVYRMQ